MSWLVYKGVHSDAMGVVVTEYPPIMRARERVQTVQVPGRDGDLTRPGRAVYEPIYRACQCLLMPGADVLAVAAWLSGRGDVVFGNEPDYAYEARTTDEIRMEKLLREREHRTFEAVFACQPFKKLATTEADIVLTASGSVQHPGTAASRPRIKVAGAGDITLMVGTQIMTIAGLTQDIVLDSAVGMAMDATGTINMCALTGGDFPLLHPGSNAISWSGNVTKVTITPRWRWL